MLKLLNGPQTLGSGPVFWAGFAVVLALVLAYPLFATPYDVGNFAYFLIWIFMALGLCLMWGYGGIMSFGQTFFFGLAGYGYGVIAINMGGKGSTTFAALGLSVLLSGAAAAILGYFMIWGGIRGVFFGIVTLSATLVLAFFLGQTAGPEWNIGPARLNGFNGMKGMKPLNIPWAGIPRLRGLGALLSDGGADGGRLPGAAHAREFAHRQCDRCDPRKPAARRDARLRRPQVSARDFLSSAARSPA